MHVAEAAKVAITLETTRTSLQSSQMLLIKLESRGPVFFRQQRIGKGNRYFRIFKFRSMYSDRTDAAGL